MWGKSHHPTFVSLFSGCGGLDFGFVDAGFRCLAAFDSDGVALETHRQAIGAPVCKCDLSTGALPYSLKERPDVVLAGPPCQGFSTIGKRLLNDKRNRLLIASAKIAISLNPSVFVLENVPTVRSGDHRKYWKALETILSQAGYFCSTLSLKASDFGVAQIRKRVFLIASKRKILIDSPLYQRPKTPITLREAIGDLSIATQVINHRPILLAPNHITARVARYIQPGKKLCNVRIGNNCIHTWQIPEVFGKTTRSEREVLNALIRLRRRERLRNTGDADPVLVSSISRFLNRPVGANVKRLVKKGYLRTVNKRIDFRHTFNGKFRRLSFNQISFTVDTTFGNARNFLHPTEDRGFTVREAARIQGFPDKFIFAGNEGSQFRLVGNAVPPPVGKAIAIWILKHFRKLENSKIKHC